MEVIFVFLFSKNRRGSASRDPSESSQGPESRVPSEPRTPVAGPGTPGPRAQSQSPEFSLKDFEGNQDDMDL